MSWSRLKIYCSCIYILFEKIYLSCIHYSFIFVRNTSIIITIDLSNLNEMWIIIETMILYLRHRIKESIKEANKTNPKVKERIKNALLERLGSSIDESKLEPIALPTVLVGTKYDVFETYEPEKKKIIAKTLRFVAHYYGCGLIVRSLI